MINGGDVYVATFVNPKAKRLIEVWATNKTRASDSGKRYQLFAPGCPKGKDCDVLGESYTAEDSQGIGYETVRVHTPNGVVEQGKGFGLVLYSGTALGVALLHRIDGVHSLEGNRSRKASAWWERAQQSNLALLATGEGEVTEDEEDHCESISDSDLSDGGKITSDEVCGTVTVARSESVEYDVLLAERVRNSGLVLHYAKAGAAIKLPPADLVANIDLSNVGSGGVVDAKFLWRVAEIIAKENMDNAKRFLRRIDVQEAIANDPQVLPTYLEFFGQKRLALGGLRGGLRGAPLIEPLPLPPASAATRKLLDRFAAF